MKKALVEPCAPSRHRFYSLEPINVESQGKVVVISICSNCAHPEVYEHYVVPQLDPKGK